MSIVPSDNRPDDISSAFPEGSIKLVTRLIPSDDPDDTPTVLIEGDALSLEYLGKMILAQAAFSKDCGYGISPKGAGDAFFDSSAEIGIYIHRLPCLDVLSKETFER